MSDQVTVPRELLVWAKFAVENILLRKPIDRTRWLEIKKGLEAALDGAKPREDTPVTKK